MQQLEMFPEDIRIERVDPETNMYRFYRLRLLPDLCKRCAGHTVWA